MEQLLITFVFLLGAFWITIGAYYFCKELVKEGGSILIIPAIGFYIFIMIIFFKLIEPTILNS